MSIITQIQFLYKRIFIQKNLNIKKKFFIVSWMKKNLYYVLKDLNKSIYVYILFSYVLVS